MTIKEKLATLRKLMEREGLDAYIISGTDPHNNEYLPAAWQQREWISEPAKGALFMTKLVMYQLLNGYGDRE